jgi:hypothetical protein
MSAPTGLTDQAARHLATDRLRANGRFRRAEAGSLTEMARALLRDAREADGRGAALAQEAAGRLTPRPFAARPA